MRQLLGLDNSDDESFGKIQVSDNNNDDDSVDSFFGDGDKRDDNDDNNENEKTFTYIPGKHNLEEKIRNKLKDKEDDEAKKELTPWEKYQQKRKEKRKIKKKQAQEAKLRGKGEITRDAFDDNDSELDEPVPQAPGKETSRPSTKEELDLLLAGDNGKDDFDYFYHSIGTHELI